MGKIDNEDPYRIFQDRKRTNILAGPEQRLILYLLPRIPAYMSPNILTLIGGFGSLLILLAFVLACYLNSSYLMIGIAGLLINWFGDSLDGRIAYYRHIPRKWYGFSLDIIMDWCSTVLIGIGYYIYAGRDDKIFAFVFVVLYAWAMIISQLRYKITDHYTIDSGLVGPTELRVLIALILVLEIWITNSINVCAFLMCTALFFINLSDTRKLLKLGDIRDDLERSKNSGQP
ncbi:CDP-alcohol phosphatidyltransferase family protein [Daejeonella sp. JGW-45]|uniref:CDP-alcohol phosphatidyltransferase family protein n=1 Tax=Daejeonella sp. JGW-45 TaxID=3034148 RepID=UPI0023EAE0AD|nr:CDP-alcohol phosphatidyltransferase family protein [Daejeonella sp. JGW-45]